MIQDRRDGAEQDGAPEGAPEPGGAGPAGRPGRPRPAESRRTAGDEPTAAERRAQALRDNLHRRKAQARARKPLKGGESPPGD